MPRTLGIDPTATQSMGWAAIEDGGLRAFGQVSMGKAPPLDWYAGAAEEIQRYTFQAETLSTLINDHRPGIVAIESPIINSAAVARYLGDAVQLGQAEPFVPRLTGAVSSSIKVGLACGALIHVCVLARTPVMLLNPGTAKHFGCGSVHASKQTVREAARLRIYEMRYEEALKNNQASPNHNSIKAPSEHIAAAIFVGLAADHRWKLSQALETA